MKYFIYALALMLTLSYLVTDKTAQPFLSHHFITGEIYQVQQSSLFDQSLLLVGQHQASQFNHTQQVSIDYLYIVVLTIFMVTAVSYRYYQPKILAPPWYQLRKSYSAFRRLAWKISNLLYLNKALSF